MEGRAAAAGPAALVGIFAVMSGEAIAVVRGQLVKPTDTWSLWRPSPSTPQQTAATLRAEALTACSNRDFEGCEALLDEAAQMVPEGEHTKSVVESPEAIGAWHDEMVVGDRHHSKPIPPRSRTVEGITERSDPVVSPHSEGPRSTEDRPFVDGRLVG